MNSISCFCVQHLICAVQPLLKILTPGISNSSFQVRLDVMQVPYKYGLNNCCYMVDQYRSLHGLFISGHINLFTLFIIEAAIWFKGPNPVIKSAKLQPLDDHDKVTILFWFPIYKDYKQCKITFDNDFLFHTQKYSEN